MKQLKQKILPLFLALLMLCAAALPASAAASATASNMKLAQYTGAVNVTNSSGRGLSVRSNMQLYNGYHVETKAKSYAWINLDSTKLVKLDASSKVQIRKSGGKLELLLTSGHIYFNVTSPLTQGETLNIRTSTTVTGIRGTSGCINVIDRWTSEIYILEGSVQVNVTDPVSGQLRTTTVESGQKAVAVAHPQEQEGNKCDFVQEQIEVEDIGGFVLEELAQDPDLCKEIYEASGLDVRDVTAEDARERLARDERDLQSLLDGIGTELAGQDSIVSGGSVWGQGDSGPDPGPGTPGGSTGSGGTGNGGDTPGTPDEGDGSGGTPGEGDDSGGGAADDMTMPKTAEDVLALLEKYDTVTLKAGDTGGNTLTIGDMENTNNMMIIPEGKTLILFEGIDVTVKSGFILEIDGTVTGKGTLTVEDGGELIVNNTLEMTSVVNSGVLINQANGKIKADSIKTSGKADDDLTGFFSSQGAIEGTVTVEGGDAGLIGGEIISSGSEATVSVTGGKLNLKGGMITNSGAGYALSVSGSPEITCGDGTILRAKQNDRIARGFDPDHYGYTQPEAADEDGYYRLVKTGA